MALIDDEWRVHKDINLGYGLWTGSTTFIVGRAIDQEQAAGEEEEPPGDEGGESGEEEEQEGESGEEASGERQAGGAEVFWE